MYLMDLLLSQQRGQHQILKMLVRCQLKVQMGIKLVPYNCAHDQFCQACKLSMLNLFLSHQSS